MLITRRHALRSLALGCAWIAGLGAGVLRAGQAVAAAWNKAGFEAKAVADVLKSLGAAPLTEAGTS